jgi:hypothetical protein
VIDNVDARMVVALYRLAQFLGTTWGVTEIRHKGIGHGNPAFPSDCHNTGRALDLSGLRGVLPAGQIIPGLPSQFDLDVMRDWGNQNVPVPGPNAHTWPTNLHGTAYRLSPITSPIAWALFQAVYNFAVQQFADTSEQRFGNTMPPTLIGSTSRLIIHPDHPDPSNRAAHQDHIHMQIATTGLEMAPP